MAKPVERIYANLEVARARYVIEKEKDIRYGGNWEDLEVGEVDTGNRPIRAYQVGAVSSGGDWLSGSEADEEEGARTRSNPQTGVEACVEKVVWVKPRYAKVYHLKLRRGSAIREKRYANH